MDPTNYMQCNAVKVQNVEKLEKLELSIKMLRFWASDWAK